MARLKDSRRGHRRCPRVRMMWQSSTLGDLDPPPPSTRASGVSRASLALKYQEPGLVARLDACRKLQRRLCSLDTWLAGAIAPIIVRLCE